MNALHGFTDPWTNVSREEEPEKTDGLLKSKYVDWLVSRSELAEGTRQSNACLANTDPCFRPAVNHSRSARKCFTSQSDHAMWRPPTLDVARASHASRTVGCCNRLCIYREPFQFSLLTPAWKCAQMCFARSFQLLAQVTQNPQPQTLSMKGFGVQRSGHGKVELSCCSM